LFSTCYIYSCASAPTRTKVLNNYSVDPSLANKIKGSGAINLLSHQLVPIDYLHKHPEQKGILINHYMGAGKTFLGIGLAESFPGHPVIIIGPRFLESQWKTELERYGVKDPDRYTFFSYDDAPAKIAKENLTNHIVLADEVHNIMKKLRSPDIQESLRYSDLYLNLKNSYKIIGLTGTPIYSDESDLAFILNLVSGQDLMPTNQETFRLQYTEILPTRKFFRGYFTESQLIQYTIAPFLGVFGASLFGPWGLLLAPVGLIGTVGVNAMLDTNFYKFRRLNIDKMEPIMTKYISYFKFDESQFKDFPGQKFVVKNVPYNKYQYSYFLHLVEGDLPVDQLQRLLLNDNIKLSKDQIRLNSSAIHERFYSQIGAGRDIGNFEFRDEQNQIIEAPKFLAVYKELMANDEPTVIYSNYFQTGILAFEQFLHRQKFNRPYGIVHPNLPMEKVRDLVSDYNSGKIKLLMLHPEVTEGISLRGTQFLHILEPMLNNNVLEQVVGRTRRFQSHSHLPREMQLVNVMMWQSTSSTWHPELGVINRANWYKRYQELSYMSRWGIGIAQIDHKYHLKALNPEELSLIKLQAIENNLKEMQKSLSLHSIENLYVAKR